MKKLISVLFLSFVLILSGCGKEEVKKTDIKINENGVYEVPANPFDYQAELFNELTTSLNSGNEEETASLVARNFACDFFTLKNKDSAQQIGGLTYLPQDRVEEFKTFAMSYVYANYPKIKKDEGASELPIIKEIKVENIEAAELSYTTHVPANEETGVQAQTIDEVYNGYQVTLALSYEKTSVNTDDLKTSCTIRVINLDGRLVVIGLE